MNNEDQSVQTQKARLGAIGENNVVSILMQKGWDAFNANCTIKNFKSIDIVCLNSDRNESEDCTWKPKTALIQVKTCQQTCFPVGFTIEQSIDKNYLEKMVKGPYVFVYACEVNDKFDFKYYILSRTQLIELLYQSHYYYVHGYKREKKLNLQSPAGLHIRWFKGMSDKATNKHIAFDNPIKTDCEDCWDNIWED